MDFIENILGIRDRGDSITGLIRGLSRWVIGCGCLLIVGVIALIIALLTSIVTLGDQAIMIIVVFGTIIVAVISLIRSSLDR